jgi:Uma2 family endonuclease
MTTTQAITTAEQLLHAPDLGRCELVRGELIMMSPSGFEHGRIVVAITFSVASYIKQHPLGVLTGAEGGYLIARDPDTVRAPDLGFILRERVPAEPVRGFFPGAPDLAVEVLSPDDRASEVLAKVRDWRQAGCRLVWVVDPRTRTVSVYRDSGQVLALREPDALGGEDLLPGFSVPLAEIFAPCGAAEK